MKLISPFFSTIIFTGLFSACTHPGKKEKNNLSSQKYPNVIYILADDLGYGDISCYGQTKFQTPNIDRLAKEGMLFTQHYAGTTVCAPSRSSLLTGQHTGHTPVRGNLGMKPEGQWPLPEESFTIAEMLKKAQYVTGAFGKWGLGFIDTEGNPVKQGFDVFYGYNCQTLAHNYYPDHLWSNNTKIDLQGNSDNHFEQYAPELIQKKALEFIEQNMANPFFLYYPSTIPHAELLLPEKYLAEFRGKFLPEKEYEGIDFGEDKFRKGGYGSQPESHAAFAAMVTLLDKQVGEILARLEELGIEKNTLVIFTSDNGPHLEGGADPDYFNSNGILKGYKRDLYEGGIRVPMLARWPGKIESGAVTDHISAFWDVMPTFAELIGAEPPENIDGISFLPTLLEKNNQKQHEYLYWEFHEKGGRQALRSGDWKLVRYHVFDSKKTTTELYNLRNDPGESDNLATKHPEKTDELFRMMELARTPSDIFKFQSKTVIR